MKKKIMSREISSSIVINSPLEPVSVALNGLLNMENVKHVFTEYHIDLKNDYRIRHSEEKNTMGIIYKNISTMDFYLSQQSSSKTIMNYKLIYNQIKILDIVLGVIAAAFFLAAIIVFFFFESIGIMFSCMFLIFGLIYLSLTLFSVFYIKRTRRVDMMFHKIFLTRLDEYIEMFQMHQNKANAVEQDTFS